MKPSVGRTPSRIFDRIPRFDRRSRRYAARDAFWPWTRRKTRNWSCYVTLDQGREGACVGFGCAHEAAATPVIVPDITAKVAKAIYQRAKQLDQWPGEAYEGTSVLAGMKAGKEKGWWKEYRWAFSERELALSIGYLGPCVLGVNWYEGMSEPDENGRIRPTGSLLGGHAILCSGYDAKFQSTRPGGARRGDADAAVAGLLFQSTRPGGARPDNDAGGNRFHRFQSTRPGGARPAATSASVCTCRFQSTRPGGARLDPRLVPVQDDMFQSTRPGGARP